MLVAVATVVTVVTVAAMLPSTRALKPPACHSAAAVCTQTSHSYDESVVGEYFYNITGKTIIIGIWDKAFELNFLNNNISFRDLPSYDRNVSVKNVHLSHFGYPSEELWRVLRHLNVTTERLLLDRWAPREPVAAFSGLEELPNLELEAASGRAASLQVHWAGLAALRRLRFLSVTRARLLADPTPAAPPQLQVLRLVDSSAEGAWPQSLRQLELTRSPLSAPPPRSLHALYLHSADAGQLYAHLLPVLANLTMYNMNASATSRPLQSLAPTLRRVIVWQSPVPDGWLAGLPFLQSVEMQYCPRTTPLRDPLGPAPGTRPLALTVVYCALERLPERLLAGQSLLQLLNLGHNALRELTVGVFAEQSNLRLLKLNNNRLTWLPEDLVSHCKHLEELWLAHNQLTHLAGGSLPRSLRMLYLEHNNFTQLQNSDLRLDNTELTAIYEHNRISRVEWDLEEAPRWGALRLAGNPLACGAGLWAARAVWGAQVEGQCAAPPQLAGRDLRALPAAEYAEVAACGPCQCTCRPDASECAVQCGLDVVAALPALPALPRPLQALDLRQTPGLQPAAAAALLTAATDARVMLACTCGPLLAALHLHRHLHTSALARIECEDGSGAARAAAACAAGVGAGDAGEGAVVAGVAGAAAAAAVLAVALYYLHRRHAARKGSTKGEAGGEVEQEAWSRPYDAFVSYAHEDAAWVLGALLPWLERGGWRVCEHARDWAPGGFVPAQILASVAAARRTLLVVSPHYARSAWARAELRAAAAHAARARHRHRVLPLVLADTDTAAPADTDLARHLAAHTHLRVDDPRFWDKLAAAMPPLAPPSPPPPPPVTDHAHVLHL